MRNFNMNFDFIYDVEICDIVKKDLIKGAINAEKNARMNPFNSMVSARFALEALIKGIMKKNDRSTEKHTLDQAIRICLDNGYISRTLEQNLTEIRLNGNRNIHVSMTPHTENIKKSVSVLKSLFTVCKEYFNVNCQFDEEKIPFDQYYIKRAVKKVDGEIIYGNYNYFVFKEDGNEYFLQRFSLSDGEFQPLVIRSEESRSAILNSFGRKSYLPSIENVETSNECDYRPVVYSVPKNSQLLSELQNTNLSKKKALKIAIDLVYTLLEMKEIRSGIHHRNINPGCVIISFDESGKNCMATLVNMQMSKIVDGARTVVQHLSAIHENNPFQPADIRNLTEEQLSRTNWEKVDVYSVAKIILYCMDPKLVLNSAQPASIVEKLFDKNFSDTFVEFLTDILEGDINNNPSLEEMKEVFVNEFNNKYFE